MALYISTVLLPWMSGIELGALYNLWLLGTLSGQAKFQKENGNIFIISQSPSCLNVLSESPADGWFSHTEIDLSAVSLDAFRWLILQIFRVRIYLSLLCNQRIMKDTAMRTLHATCTTFISIQILQHIHLLFHKYHRTPHVVTGFITVTVTKTCAKIACKHLVNIQTSDHFFHSGHEKRFTYNRLSFHTTAKAIFKLHGKFTFTKHQFIWVVHLQ